MRPVRDFGLRSPLSYDPLPVWQCNFVFSEDAGGTNDGGEAEQETCDGNDHITTINADRTQDQLPTHDFTVAETKIRQLVLGRIPEAHLPLLARHQRQAGMY